MARTILIEVRVEEIDSLEPGYISNPKTAYELVPVDHGLDGSIEFTCRKRDLAYTLGKFDRKDLYSSRGMAGAAGRGRPIYGEPEEEVGTLLRDAFKKVLSGFNMPALDVIVDSIEEAVMPDRVRQRHKRNKQEEDEE